MKMKVPWRTILRVVGVLATGTAAVWGAVESDDKVQKAVKMVASKSLETMEKKS
jgi:hypothetical protein